MIERLVFIDELPAWLRAQGLQLNNLFQLQSGVWRASLKLTNSIVFEFADGATPAEALNNCSRKMTPHFAKKNRPQVIAAPKSVKAESADALLKELGL